MNGPQKTKLGLIGATGRTGRYVLQLLQAPDSEFAQQTEISASFSRGNSAQLLLKSEVVIDFSLPEVLVQIIGELKKDFKNHPASGSQTLPAFVIATTGWSKADLKCLDELAEHTAVLRSSNFSTGVLALQKILRQASPLLLQLGFTPVMVETHHLHKKDAPSGTALMLQKAIAPDHPERVPIHSVRAGGVVGDHEVSFYQQSEIIRMGHFAQDRSLFARGAILVSLWLAQQRRLGRPETQRGLISIESFLDSHA